MKVKCGTCGGRGDIAVYEGTCSKCSPRCDYLGRADCTTCDGTGRVNVNLGDTVELTRDCDLGAEGDRATIVAWDDADVTLRFSDDTLVHTGSDYSFLRKAW